MTDSIDFSFIETNGIRLHVAQAGPLDGPAILLLHGFPEYWQGWRHQIDDLVGQGFRVIVPDQRGYNLSDKPQEISAYNLDTLTADAAGLLDALGHERVYVAGHDWGGVVAWWLAVTMPERIRKLAILNVAHPLVMMDALKFDWNRIRKSWYMFFYNTPNLPEAYLRGNEWQALRIFLQGISRLGTFTEEDMAAYRKAWEQPGALTAMLNWYRAMFQAPPKRPDSARVTVPTLLIWGSEDRVFDREVMQDSLAQCDNGRLETIEGATHWVQHEETQKVNALLRDFFNET